MKTHPFRRTLAWSLLPLCLGLAQPSPDLQAATLFEETFDTDTSAAWSVLASSADFTAEFAFDYGAVPFSYQDPVTGVIANRIIPPAPRSVGGTTKALKVTVNKNDDVAAVAGVSVYPKDVAFSGNYALKFDMWINYNGNAGGGSGSTEFANFGINHVGDVVNWTVDQTAGDGIWFAVSGENGAAQDYRSYLYDGTAGKSGQLLGAAAGLIGTDPFSQPLFGDRFTSPPFENRGCVGKQWVAVEVRQRDGELTWSIDGFVIARRVNDSGFDSGTIMLGTMDIFSGIADPRAENYVLFDNVQVVSLDETPPLSVVRITATDPDADEPSADAGAFTVSREGSDNSRELTVAYRIAGTAANGTDYDSLPGSVALPAGVDSVGIGIVPANDVVGEPTEDVTLTLVPGPGYELFQEIKGTVNITDSGDNVVVSLATRDGFAYERLEADTASFLVTRQGDLTSDLEVAYTVGGSATAGEDYQALAGSVVILAGNNTALVLVTPINDMLREGAENVSLTLTVLPSYEVSGEATASVTLTDDDRRPGTVLFADNFDADSSANWEVKFNAVNGINDYSAVFLYDYSQDAIPPAPHSDGSTLGLMTTVNKADAAASAAAVNVILKAGNFTGDYALRFDMFLTYGVAAGTTEHAIFGVNHSGTGINRHALAGTDGLWFAVETDGSGSGGGRSYTRYYSTNSATAPAFEAKPFNPFTAFFTTPPYLASGAPSGQWVDVEVAQIGGVLTLILNGTTIFTVDRPTLSSGTLMLGHMDSFNSIGSVKNFTVFDNVRVVDLNLRPVISGIRLNGGNVDVSFRASEGAAGDFRLERADAVGGPYEAVAGASVTANPDGSFTTVTSVGDKAMGYFRIGR